MRSRVIYLVNPRTESFTTRRIFFGRALYSPLAGLLAVASLIPRDRYEVMLTDENVESIDFDRDVDLVGISAMTSYVKRGYAIADQFRARGVPVVMGGVHPSFMPNEALRHADAVVIGEAELVMPRLLEDLERGCLRGTYKADRLHNMVSMPQPRYDLLKANRYVNKSFIQTSRGCHHACMFCAEHLVNGLKFRHRPVNEVLAEIEATGNRTIALNDADFFGDRAHAIEVMRALKGRGYRWQAGVNAGIAGDDEILQLAAESGCYMLSIGFESISRATLKGVHKNQNTPETYHGLVEKLHKHGILVFGLFMFGFDGDDPSVFSETAQLNRSVGYDACAYSVLTPYPGTLTWYRMRADNRIVSYDWDKYDQGCVVYEPKGISPHELVRGHYRAYEDFYSLGSIASRFPRTGSRSRFYWAVYNLFMRKGFFAGASVAEPVAPPTSPPTTLAEPPLLPQKGDWQALVRDVNRSLAASLREDAIVEPAAL